MAKPSEEEIRKTLKHAIARAKAQGHPYDQGYADALAWVLGEKPGQYAK